MKFNANISYESDFKPVRTVKLTFESANQKSALRMAGRLAAKSWPKSEQFRSWVICIEKIEDKEDD